MSLPRLAWLLLAFAVPPLLALGERQSEEAFYDSRFPRDCVQSEIPEALRQQIKRALRSEFKKQNAEIEQIGVLDIQCVHGAERQMLGAIVVGYGLVRDPQTRTVDIQNLLKNEQFGVFQFDGSLAKLRKTVTMFPSQRWLDYFVTVELPSANRLIVNGHGSYGDSRMRQEFSLAW